MKELKALLYSDDEENVETEHLENEFHILLASLKSVVFLLIPKIPKAKK